MPPPVTTGRDGVPTMDLLLSPAFVVAAVIASWFTSLVDHRSAALADSSRSSIRLAPVRRSRYIPAPMPASRSDFGFNHALDCCTTRSSVSASSLVTGPRSINRDCCAAVQPPTPPTSSIAASRPVPSSQRPSPKSIDRQPMRRSIVRSRRLSKPVTPLALPSLLTPLKRPLSARIRIPNSPSAETGRAAPATAVTNIYCSKRAGHLIVWQSTFARVTIAGRAYFFSVAPKVTAVRCCVERLEAASIVPIKTCHLIFIASGGQNKLNSI